MVQKTAEATEDLTRNKIADKINSIIKSKEKEKTKQNKFIFHQKKDNKLLMTLNLSESKNVIVVNKNRVSKDCNFFGHNI